MTVGRPRISTIDVGVPGVGVDAVAGLVASAGARALVHRHGGLRDVLLLDLAEGVLRGRGGGGGDDDGLAALAPGLPGFVGSGHGGVEGGEVAHHPLVLLLLVGVYGLCMLAEVVETRKLL